MVCYNIPNGGQKDPPESRGENDMKSMTAAERYSKAGNLQGRWNLLCAWRKRYAAHLVRKYGYPVHIAVEQSYLFGYSQWPYDYRNNCCATETVPRSRFDRG